MLEPIAPDVIDESLLLLEEAQKKSGIEIRSLVHAHENSAAQEIFDLVWPPTGGGTQVPSNLLRAITHAGGYCSAAFIDDQPVAAALGVLGIHQGKTGPHLHLHSHMAGVIDGYRNRRIGTAIKAHQRYWALRRGIDTIVWTFDPLVSRNARLNLVNLGVTVRGYETNFYGSMTDSINAGDESDRVFAWWELTSTRARQAVRGELAPIVDLSPTMVVIETPDDIVALRESDMPRAREWRVRVREDLNREFAAGREIIGVTPSGDYVLDLVNVNDSLPKE